MAAMCFVHEGETARAERVFDYYAKHFAEQFAPGSLGGFPQAANAETGELLLDTDRWIGDNAWLLLALNYHHAKTGSAKYAAMRKGIGEWLVSLQNPDGGIKAGFNKSGPMLHYSTEGNLDCAAALVDFPEQQKKVIAFLERDMYVADGPYFKMGSTVSEPALDTCSWGVLVLGKKYAPLLKTAEARFKRDEVTAEGSGRKLAGFSDFVDKQRVWLEGTGEVGAAYNVAGRAADAQKVVTELEKAFVPSVAHEGLIGIAYSTSEPSWKGATTLPFTPSQAWYLCTVWNFNPMTGAPVAPAKEAG